MIKKLIKYGKIAMAMCLIMALALPSYATVGASDGSAFVTKAEFDAVMSDFNARLTTFESGINSKIDSQVSSYLDTNGIWSGKTQAIENSLLWTWQNCTNPSGGKTSGTYYFPMFTSSNNYYSIIKGFTMDGTEPIYPFAAPGDVDNLLINKITKSGMLVMDWNWRTCYYQDNKAPATSAANVRAGNGGHGGASSTFWLKSLFADLDAENPIKDITTYPSNTVNWSGFYFARNGLGDTWTNLNFRHDLQMIVTNTADVERIAAVQNVGDVILQSTTNGQKQKGDKVNGTSMWNTPWADPRGRCVTKFFVSRDEKLKIRSHIGMSGWATANFFARSQSQMMWAVAQINDLKIY